MTLAPEQKPDATPVPEGHVRLTIDGLEVDAPKGELIIRTCERLGIIVPRFCDHPLLDPAGACRQCLVEVEMGGRPMPKPQASCTMTVAGGMVVKTQHTSPVADKAQQGVMELLLINHPLDCPVCDKGGECPLQNQAMSNGRTESRFVDVKRTYPKPLPISSQVLLDRERCVLCARCTRFSQQVAGDPFIELFERGALQQVAIYADQPFESYFSGNTVQICPVGACRQCLVEVEGQRKPAASCTMPVTEGMVVQTQLTSEVADKAQQGTMELLLINHPLDCPVCDKGGECPLQNQAMSNGRTESRFVDVKRTYPKPIPISTEILLDRERCVLCARCTRFSQQVAGDPFIELFERGALEQVAIYEDEPFESYFSGNTTQICPVGALTSAQYRFRARPFDLRSEPSVCEHCASGCAQRTDYRRGKVTRRLAGDDPAVNEEWNCDKGRYAFRYVSANARLTTPLVRRDGELQPASWPEAWAVAAAGLLAAREDGGVGVLPGGRLTVEDAYAYAKFALSLIHI